MPTRPVGSCTIEGCDQHYACRLRTNGIQFGPSTRATATLNSVPTVTPPPSRNAQIIYDERPGGFKMPLLRQDGSVVRQKAYDEQRHNITKTLRTLRGGS